MQTIRDDDLILFHYRDGLSQDELHRIAAALRESPALQARYQRLRALLGAVDALEPDDPDPAFEGRLWSRLQPRIASTAARTVSAPRSLRSRWRRQWTRRAVAAAASLVLAVGFLGGRVTAPLPTPSEPPADAAVASAVAPPSSLATRALDAYVASHLRATEGLLLGASLSDDTRFDADEAALAAALVDSNRLYAAAAARAGNARLAGFLQQLEPVLIELANPPVGTRIERHEGLRDFIDDADLLFELRATETHLRSRGPISS